MDAMTKYRIVLTNRGLYSVPEEQKGIPVEDLFSDADMPPMFKGAKVYLTPRGVGIGPPELPGRANDPLPDTPVVFPSRDEQIRRRDAEFHARLERAYEKVKIRALPARSYGDGRSDIENPDVAADEVRVRMMRHFPEGPGMAAVAQQAANRYEKALDKWLQKDGAWKPRKSELARRWTMFSQDHANAEREYYEAGYRPALVDPHAIDFSAVKLTGRERKAALKDRFAGRERSPEMER
jgi:hypothetical protein